MGFGNVLLNILGEAGKAVQQAPNDMLKAQQIKMQAQNMEDARIANGTKNLSTLMTLGTQIPTMQASPGYQDAISKAFSSIGIDPKTLPKNASGGIDLTTGTMSAEFSKNFANPTNYKAFSALDTAGRQQAYTAWGGTGAMPKWLESLPQTVAPVPEGLNTTIAQAVKTVQGGGDPTSSIGLLKTAFDQMPEGTTKDTMLNDAVNSVLSASTSPQARLAIATKNTDYQKLVQDYKNAITTGKVDNATLQEDLARVGLIKAQTKVQEGIPAVQASEEAKNYASAGEASASAEHLAAETAKTNTENFKLVNEMAYNVQHGIPANIGDVQKLQSVSASLSNQVKQWGDVKAKALEEMHGIEKDVKTLDQGVWSPEATKAYAALQARYNNANNQLSIAMQRQKNAAPLLALPNGMRPFAPDAHAHPVPAGTHPQAMMHGKPIFVQNGKWVFQDGSEAK